MARTSGARGAQLALIFTAIRADPRRFVLPATILGSSLGFIDASVVNVALPAMERSLGASLGTLQWVMNGYLLTLASLILLGGTFRSHASGSH